MGNCITAPFRGNYRNCSGARAARRGAAGGEVAGRDRRRPQVGGALVATGGDGGCGRHRQGASRQGTSLAGRRGCDVGAQAVLRSQVDRARWRERDQNHRGAHMRQASQVWTIERKARSTKPQAAVTKRPSGTGNIFAPCMISGPSTRKTALDGKILAPCTQNHPIAPGNGHMGQGSCHFYPKKHAWDEDVARKRAYCAHSAKRERIRRDSCQMGPRPAAMQGRVRGLWGGAVGDAARASNTANNGVGRTNGALAGATGRRRDTGGCGAGTTLAGTAVWGRDAGGIGGDRKLARRRLGASLAALAGTAVQARRWRTRGAAAAGTRRWWRRGDSRRDGRDGSG